MSSESTLASRSSRSSPGTHSSGSDSSEILLITRFDFNQPLLILCIISSLISLSVFVLSMLDLGQPSMYMAPAIPSLTFVFYTILCILGRIHRLRHRRRRKLYNSNTFKVNDKTPYPRPTILPSPYPPLRTCPPSYSIPSIILTSFLSALWIIPFLMTLWVVLKDSMPGEAKAPVFRAGNMRTILAQAILSGVNIILIGVTATCFGVARSQFLKSLDADGGAHIRTPESRKSSGTEMSVESATCTSSA